MKRQLATGVANAFGLNLSVNGFSNGYPAVGESPTETNTMIANLEKDTSLGLSQTKKGAMIAAARELLKSGFELAFDVVKKSFSEFCCV
jgi:hypothetical protein